MEREEQNTNASWEMLVAALLLHLPCALGHTSLPTTARPWWEQLERSGV